MKILTLIIKQKFFDEILSGEKKQEFREITPKSVKKYCQIDDEGYVLEDKDGILLPREYDAIRFYVGYNKDRQTALVKIEGAAIEIFVDAETDEPITYEYEGGMYEAAQVVYDLGEIIERGKGV